MDKTLKNVILKTAIVVIITGIIQIVVKPPAGDYLIYVTYSFISISAGIGFFIASYYHLLNELNSHLIKVSEIYVIQYETDWLIKGITASAIASIVFNDKNLAENQLDYLKGQCDLTNASLNGIPYKINKNSLAMHTMNVGTQILPSFRL
jgi:hypothetical protein